MQCMTRIDKNDILRQYNDKYIMYSDSLQYHLIISETEKSQYSGESIANVMWKKAKMPAGILSG